jgi:carbonic anhydrase
MDDSKRTTPAEALGRLLEGNRRFVAEKMTHAQNVTAKRRNELTAGQTPYAAILACADSRVSPEHVFDAGLGELFVCRNAGNVVDPLIVGSLEYVVAHCGCPLIAIVGHTGCGAITATVSALQNETDSLSPNLEEVARALLRPVLAERPSADSVDLAGWVNAAVKRNIDNVCRELSQRSPLISQAAEKRHTAVVGLVHDLKSGRVDVRLAPPWLK